MRLSIIPKDSCIRQLIQRFSITEAPLPYQIAFGLSSIGALLKRSVFIDQVEWRVYPNMSVLAIGPSGVGKDTVINRCVKIIHQIEPGLQLNGNTIEHIQSELAQLGELAAAYIPAQEITAFLGGKDYQKGIVQSLTDMLSTGHKIVLGTKSEGKKVISRPTITIHAGSTADWLRNLPEKSIEGGFLPRFLIVCAEFTQKHVAWPKYDHDHWARQEAKQAGEDFVKIVKEIVKKFGGRELERDEREMTPTPGAEQFYRNWYHNRFKFFSPNVQAYANRARDHVHRLAMLMAISRMHGYMEEEDYSFAVGFMEYVASGIDKVIAPMLMKRKER